MYRKIVEKEEICWYFYIKYLDFFEIVFNFIFNYIKFIMKFFLPNIKLFCLHLLVCQNFRFSIYIVNLKLNLNLVFAEKQKLWMWVLNL